MITERFRTLLASTAGGRVYPLVAQQPTTKPYVTYQRVAGVVENVLEGNGTPPITNTRLQVDVYSTTYAEAQSIAASIVALMQGWSERNILLQTMDMYEDDARLFRVLLEFSIWHNVA